MPRFDNIFALRCVLSQLMMMHRYGRCVMKLHVLAKLLGHLNLIREAGAREKVLGHIYPVYRIKFGLDYECLKIAQIELLRVTPRATLGVTPRATPNMIYYCAYTTQTAARSNSFDGTDGICLMKLPDGCSVTGGITPGDWRAGIGLGS